MIADDYRVIREAMRGANEKPPQTPAIGQGGRVAATEAVRRNDADAATRRHYIRRAREQNERMKR